MKKIISFIILIILFGGNSSFSQTVKKFSEDPALFVTEFTEMMTQRISAEDQIILDEFLGYFMSGAFNNDDKTRIIFTSNLLLQKRARPHPHFRNYIRTLSVFKKRAVTPDNYISWEKGFMDLLEDRKYNITKINRFLEVSYLIITENILYKSSSVTWKTGPVEIKMVYKDKLILIIPQTEIMCHAQRDSIIIYHAAGTFDPANIIWFGKGGKVTWERAGFNPEEVFALLGNYTIDMTKTGYQADSILFTHKGYFPQPIQGILVDKVKRTPTTGKATFPVFQSFTKRFSIKNLYQDIDYEGGFSLLGSTVNGTGTSRENARLKFFKNDTLRLIVNSNSFQIKSSRISSAEALISLYIENDSIFHPNIVFTYNMSNREVSLFSTDNPITKSPYFNSYHKIDMNFDQLVWKMDDLTVRMTMARGATLGQARFKSSNYFNENHFLKMQGMDEIHPLFALKKFSEWYYSDEFPISEFASWMNKHEFQIQHLIVRLANEGFVFYDPEKGEIKIKPQLYDYLQANAGKIDYDVIDFISNTRAPQDNARLNLANNELTIYGIPRIFLSDSQNVEILPAENKIILKKNRDFNFGGKVQAGLMTFFGNDFSFRYDSFKVELKNIDSLNLAVLGKEVDLYGNRNWIYIKNNIENITGELYIDEPENKSGLKYFFKYPFFRSTASSFVYYDVTEGIDSIIYPKDKFYYELNPFEIAKLTDLRPEDIKFAGDFYCGDIFPILKQDLLVRHDMSLGFTYNAPSEGLPAYGGLATFYDSITLSNKGIEGAGKVKYLTSTSKSENFHFYPDSLISDNVQFNIEKDSLETKFPHVSAHDISIKWYPQKDEFYVFKKVIDLNIFDDQIAYSGNLVVRSSGLAGDGTLFIKNSEISSNQFVFGDIYFNADTSDLKFISDRPGVYALVAEKVNASVIIDEGGIFTSQVDTLPVYFPEKNYISSMDLLMWDIEHDRIDMLNEQSRNDPYQLGSALDEGQWETPPTFISMNSRTDSLGFKSDSAVYKLDDHTLEAHYVEFLEIADALIFPGGRSLTLEKNGYMRGFTNARIIANGMHELSAEKIDILSRKDYYGSGFYNYIDKDNRLFKIRFSDIIVNDKGHTFASGEITAADSFSLSPWFSFEGKVVLDAEKEFLNFSGGTILAHNCANISRSLISFTSDIDPKKVRIPVPVQPVATNGVRIYNGIYITSELTHVYPAFFSKKKNYSDTPIAIANGFLEYDERTGQYKIGEEQKLLDHFQAGNLLAFDRNYCKVYGEGKLDLGINLGQLKLTIVGNITDNIELKDVRLDLVLGMDFFFAPEAMQIMAQEINSVPTLKPVDLSRNTYLKGMTELMGSKTQPSDDDLLFGAFQEVDAKTRHTILFTQLQLVWNEESSSYLSVGKIGIGNIDGTPLNRLVDGYIEIQKKRSGDMMDVFLQIDERTWYYFGYTTGVMQSLTTNRNYLDVLSELNTNQRRLKVPSGQTSYIYMPASDRKIGNFRRRMRMVLEENEFTGSEQ